MAKSERAKALAAKQKEEIRARKLAKKNSSDPRDWGALRQMKEVFRLTKEHDPKLSLIMVASFILPAILVFLFGFWLSNGSWLGIVMWTILAIMSGITVAMGILTRRAKRGTFLRYEGKAGSGEVALSMLPSKKWFSTPGVAVTKNFDAVHRTIGPGGLILIGDGDPGRLKGLLASEKRKHDQVLYGVESQVIQMGNGTGQIPLAKLADHIRKLPKQLSPQQIEEAKNRMRSLDAMRPKAPVPRGPISMKGARKAMRGH